MKVSSSFYCVLNSSGKITPLQIWLPLWNWEVPADRHGILIIFWWLKHRRNSVSGDRHGVLITFWWLKHRRHSVSMDLWSIFANKNPIPECFYQNPSKFTAIIFIAYFVHAIKKNLYIHSHLSRKEEKALKSFIIKAKPA